MWPTLQPYVPRLQPHVSRLQPYVIQAPFDAGDAGAGSLVRFQPTPRMSTYIVAFAVGEFEAVRGTGPRGIPVSVYRPHQRLAF